ncbi:OLC1v1009348C1 [Oldenlandia corymbosa var. corymbosa]|uniref:OLC1v1009348C1 n=1 Tax=Oldenlandia corymbosa var. corymbosa TaxID=529605 RepID=A0AAV1DNS3_OLDCO|nr:OLC1v1009348C1 [Oldenlandia corymbosa var. corymbosa]
MPEVYDNWDRLVSAVLHREEDREAALRTPSELSLVSSSPFSLAPFHGRVSSFSSRLSVGESCTYNQILKITDYFDDSKLIKKGHSGDFYLGVLQSGIHVVVKRVNLSSSAKRLSSSSEIEICGMVNHHRLIPLLGHCWGNAGAKFLVYKYMHNKDLSKVLNGEICRDWRIRLKIATESAEGLCHLHHACFPPLVHRDIQGSSILLDDNFEVRLGSLTGTCTEEASNKPNGVSRFLWLPMGFQQRNSGRRNATRAYDVYCFGKVLLELITGKLGLSSAKGSRMKNWMTKTLPLIVLGDKKLIADIVDPFLFMDEDTMKEVWEVAFIAKACLSSKPSEQPKMAQIFKALKGLLARTSVRICPNGKIHPRSSSRIFTLEELKDATGNFGMDCWLGEDEFGELYQGLLQEKSKSHDFISSPIVVKKMHLRKEKGFQQSKAEAEMLRRLCHPNILKLVGYCFEDDQLLLAYESTQEGSLNKYFSEETSAIRDLTWDRRLKILIGAARGLAFLDSAHRQGFFQLKKVGEGFYGYFNCSKIYIDSDYNPKITGFSVTAVDPPDDLGDVHPKIYRSGKYEYAAPEYKHPGFWLWEDARSYLHLKSDVYGFGVVLVRMLTGVDNHHHTSQITELKPLQFVERDMDGLLKGVIPLEAAEKMAQLAQLCLRHEHELRPSIEQVVEILEGIEKIKSSGDDLNELDSLLEGVEKLQL